MTPSEYSACVERMNEGIARAYRGADNEWKAAVAETIPIIARQQQFLTTLDVLDYVKKHELGETHDNRAIGPMMRLAQKAGILEKVGYTPNPRSNMRLNVQWRSLVFEGQQ